MTTLSSYIALIKPCPCTEIVEDLEHLPQDMCTENHLDVTLQIHVIKVFNLTENILKNGRSTYVFVSVLWACMHD